MVREMIENIQHLSEQELLSLNSALVEQLKRTRRQNAALAKATFSVGDEVGFGDKGARGKRSYKDGTIVTIKRTRAEVLVSGSGKWTVPLNMIRGL